MRLAANERRNGIAGRVLNNAGVQLATRFHGPSENATDAEECECEGRRLHCWQGVGIDRSPGRRTTKVQSIRFAPARD